MAKNEAKAKQHPEAELLAKICFNGGCFNEIWLIAMNMKVIGKIDPMINRTRCRHDRSMQNIACFGKIMSIWNKQHFIKIWGPIR